MSRTFPIGIVLLLAVTPAPADDLSGLVLPDYGRYARHLEAAHEHLEKKDWGVAVTLLQRLLDLPEDGFATVRQPAAGGKPAVTRVISLRAEAGRLLGTMPAEGIRVYRAEYGPAAVLALAQAKGVGDMNDLAEVWARYFHTDAGAEAAFHLAGYLLDRDRTSQASLIFERLLDRPLTD